MSNDAFAFVGPALLIGLIVICVVVAGVTSILWWVFL